MMSKKCPWCNSEKAHKHLELKDYFLTQEDFEIWVCEDCGLLYTSPRPAPEKIGDYYKSEAYYSHQENKIGLIPRIYESVKKVNLKHKVNLAIGGLEKGKLLDIGCGVGDFLQQIESKGWQCTGIEPSEDAAKIAKKRIQATIYKPEEIDTLIDETYDVITMWHVLEHVDDLRTEVEHLFRLLKKGGRLVIALPNYKSYDATYYQDKWAAYDVPRHLNHFDKQTIVNIFNTKGLKLIKIDKLKWDAYYISFMSEKYKQNGLPLVRGLIRGLISNCKARKSGEWSSLVYVFEK